MTEVTIGSTGGAIGFALARFQRTELRPPAGLSRTMAHNGRSVASQRRLPPSVPPHDGLFLASRHGHTLPVERSGGEEKRDDGDHFVETQAGGWRRCRARPALYLAAAGA